MFVTCPPCTTPPRRLLSDNVRHIDTNLQVWRAFRSQSKDISSNGGQDKGLEMYDEYCRSAAKRSFTVRWTIIAEVDYSHFLSAGFETFLMQFLLVHGW